VVAVTVIVVVAAVVVVGSNAMDTPPGAPVALKATPPVKPPVRVSVAVASACPPCETSSVVVLRAMV
jgi:hypothetical protein